MNTYKKSFLAAFSLSLMSVSSIAGAAAVLSEMSGVVMVNQGENLVTATPNMTLNANDLLTVNEGGIAKLTYPNGCVLTVTGQHLLTVAAEAPCEAGALVAAVGGGAAAAGANTALYAGLAFAGLAAIAVNANNDDERPTISQ